MAKQSPNATYKLCFVEMYVKGCICQEFKVFSPIYFQLYDQKLFFYKSIYFTKHRVIASCKNY